MHLPLASISLLWLASSATAKNDEPRNRRSYQSTPDLEIRQTPSFEAPHENLWNTFTNDEAAGVIKWLHESGGLNLTAARNATSWDNKINFVETLSPNKTDVLPYLAGSAAQPTRWARAVIIFGATEEPYMQDFAVGPLPISNETALHSMAWWSTKGESKIRLHTADGDLQAKFMTEISASIEDITLDLFNGTATGNGKPFNIRVIEPVWHREGRIIQWCSYMGQGAVNDNQSILPLGLYMQLDTTGRDPSKWKLIGWVYNGEYYKSTEAFRAAWSAPGFKKTVRMIDGDWTSTDPAGEPFKLDEKTPPVTVLPGGQRFSVDDERKYVEWGAFSFYVGFSRDTGVRLFDIRYDGERIIYELGIEEAMANYAGNDPVQSSTSYLDTFYGFGAYALELVEGYDCPMGSKFFNASLHVDELSITHRNAICMFETENITPMQRHTSGGYVSVTKNIAFVLKNVATVGNYDYTNTFTFYQDGSIETAVQASGYIQGAYYAKNEDYGYKIHDALSGSMHDHVINYRCDFDILGTNNTLAKHTIVPAAVEYPWSNGVALNTMKLERAWVENEDEGKINWPANGVTMYVVVNKDAPNKYGEPRGYRIMPGAGVAHLIIQDSPNLPNSQSYATSDLYVTKRKDTERHSVHAMNLLDPANPIVDFSKWFNGESLVQEDIVIHFNLGMHHVPQTGDLPNTVTTTAHSSVMITPHNYLLSDPSRRSKQQVKIRYGDVLNTAVQTFGAQEDPKVCYPMSSAFPDLMKYRGDTIVRKFPYNPLHPFDQVAPAGAPRPPLPTGF